MVDSNTENDPWVTSLQDPETQEAALTELRTILMRGLLRAFDGKGGGESFCEDVAQETLVRILAKLDMFSGRSKFTTWAMSIAIRIGTSKFRRKMFKDVSISALDSGDNLKFDWADEEAVSVERAEERTTLVGKLRELIAATLTDKQRQATEAIMHGMPIDEIASRTGSNRNAVYKLIHDARVRLKQGLESAGYTADDVLSVFA